jgi:pilus assembly protein TadC
VDDIDALVAMLIQSERFGTSIGDALRVYSENLRSKRRVIAEEAAAKIGLKLLFPLIFCIFPTLLMVLLGPPDAPACAANDVNVANDANDPDNANDIPVSHANVRDSFGDQ